MIRIYYKIFIIKIGERYICLFFKEAPGQLDWVPGVGAGGWQVCINLGHPSLHHQWYRE